MGSPERPSKQDAFLALLREGWTSLHLDARRAGVVVPAHLKGEGHLVLQYGRNLPIPIPDLQIDDIGVSATLSFARTPHRTVVPWSAVYVIASEDGRGVLYNEDVPRDISVGSEPAPADTAAPVDGEASGELAPPAPAPRRALRAVPLGAAFEEQEMSVVDEMPARPRRRRPQLRVVK